MLKTPGNRKNNFVHDSIQFSSELYKGAIDLSELSLPKINTGNKSNGEPLNGFLDISITKQRIQKAIHRQADAKVENQYRSNLSAAIKLPHQRCITTIEQISGKIEQ